MATVTVISRHEGLALGARCGEGREGLRRKGRVVLERAKQGFRIRIAIADSRSTEGRQHAEALVVRERRVPFHRAAVVGTQDEAGGSDGVLATHGREQGGRVRVTLRRLHRPSHHAAAQDFHDQVYIPEDVPHPAPEVRDMPAPQLLWFR